MALLKPFTGKERVGRVTVERFRDSLRLRWTIQGKTFSLSVGKDNTDTLKVGRATAQTIDSDITFDRFDPSLGKYGKSKSVVLELVQPQHIEQISLRNLWDNFLLDRLHNLKLKTQAEYENFTTLLDKIDNELSYNALQTKRALLGITTTDQTRRMLTYLSACCNWGIKHNIIESNPFKGLSSELPRRSDISQHSPSAFTEDERDAVIAAFKADKRLGQNYSHYASIVEFWFLTGCRPSEGVGLTWSKVSDDCSSVTFDGSVQTIKGKQFRVSGSKNNRSRTVTVSNRVKSLLEAIKPSDIDSRALVFPSPKGLAINYPNFQTKIWNKVVDSIKAGTTPYNCRDTFITLQLLKAVPSAIVAKWCDTSTGMIDKNYADKLKLSQLRPSD